MIAKAQTLLCGAALAVGAAGLLASPASGYVRTCSGPALTGCTPPDGDHSYIETRSSKTGGAASYICTLLVSGSSNVAGACSENGTFIRACYYGLYLSHGFHYGSSNAWSVDGRVATVSDATTC